MVKQDKIRINRQINGQRQQEVVSLWRLANRLLSFGASEPKPGNLAEAPVEAAPVSYSKASHQTRPVTFFFLLPIFLEPKKLEPSGCSRRLFASLLLKEVFAKQGFNSLYSGTLILSDSDTQQIYS